MEPSRAGPGQDKADPGSGQNGAGRATKAPQGCYDEGGFACKEGSASPVTYENQLRKTSNDLIRLPYDGPYDG